MHEVDHTLCMTQDHANDLCLSETILLDVGSKCDLYFVYLGIAVECINGVTINR